MGCVITHDILHGTRRVDVHEATVSFGEFPPTLVDDILASDDGPVVLQCAGGLMVEHPLLQPHVRGVEGGVDSIMGAFDDHAGGAAPRRRRQAARV